MLARLFGALNGNKLLSEAQLARWYRRIEPVWV
jgi:hypothetical protein